MIPEIYESQTKPESNICPDEIISIENEGLSSKKEMCALPHSDVSSQRVAEGSNNSSKQCYYF